MEFHQSSSLVSVSGIVHGFFTRHGGTSPKPWDTLNCGYNVEDVQPRVRENRARIAHVLSVPRDRLFTQKQVHGSHVVEVKASDRVDALLIEEADVLWTQAPNTAVGITTADCAPILVASTDGRVVCAIHAGWRGAVGGVIESAIKSLCREANLNAEDLVVAIGPCMGPDAFQVGEDVVEAVSKLVDPAVVIRTKQNGRYFDLPAFCEIRLNDVGVNKIEQLNMCTYTNEHDFFSFRRAKGLTGRQLSVIAKK